PETLQSADLSFSPSIGSFQFSVIGQQILVEPQRQLPVNQRIDLSIGGEILDKAGNRLVTPAHLSFRTEQSDSSPPKLVATVPALSLAGLGLNQAIRFEFNEPLAHAAAQLVDLALEPNIKTTVVGNTVIVTPNGL